MKTFANINEYISQFPEEIQVKLEQIRETIQQAAPEAKEAISYGMPTFVLNGNLVHFAAYKNHIGFYPAPTGIDAFINELAVYRSGKGTIQFPVDQPIPFDLVKRVVEFRVKENLEKRKRKVKKE
ncbi:MAG TPA: DUF1801 domain-containing protein [Draconibacterium sp.]|nr:DUF1801 domain-containing protein [Draconibacterium sp.]